MLRFSFAIFGLFAIAIATEAAPPKFKNSSKSKSFSKMTQANLTKAGTSETEEGNSNNIAQWINPEFGK